MKKFFKKIKLFFVGVISFLPLVSFAQYGSIPQGGGRSGFTIPNPIGADSLQELLQLILNIVVELGVPVVALMIIWTGFKFIWARGNPGKIGEAREALLYTLIGAGVVLGAYAISAIIQATVEALV